MAAPGFQIVARHDDLGSTRKALPPGEALIFTRPGEEFAFDIDLAPIGGTPGWGC